MSPISHKDAVSLAVNYIQENRFQDGIDQFCQEVENQKNLRQAGRAGMDAAMTVGFVGLSGERSKHPGEPNITPETLISYAKEDRLSFEALSAALASELENGKEISAPYRKWIARILRDEVEPPPKPKGNKRKDAGRNVVRGAILMLVDHGMKVSRNQEKPKHCACKPNHCACKPKHCACSVVAEALGDLGLAPNTYDSVLKVWKNTLWIKVDL